MSVDNIAAGLRAAEDLIGRAQRYDGDGGLESPRQTRINVAGAIALLEAVLEELDG